MANFSVCIATFNGEDFIEKQIRSILDQIGFDDEIIVVDDCSSDLTVYKIKDINDDRIKLFQNKQNFGHVFSFGRALSLSTKEFIFMADQDDIWIPGRVKLMYETLINKNVMLVTSNFEWMNENEESIFIKFDGVNANQSNKYLKNIRDIFVGKTNYFGCAMAMKSSFKKIILPIPYNVESHDLWIALAANLCCSNVHINNKTLRKRRHETNTTSTISQRSLFLKIKSRIIFIENSIRILFRIRRLQ